VAAYLARFKGTSREHTESDPAATSPGAPERGLDPLAAQRPHLELYIRWTQEIRRFKPSTVSRRFSVADGFYRTCVIDGTMEHSPAEHVRRPAVPAESPTLGFTHLQFEALLTAARQSTNPCDLDCISIAGGADAERPVPYACWVAGQNPSPIAPLKGYGHELSHFHCRLGIVRRMFCRFTPARRPALEDGSTSGGSRIGAALGQGV